MDNNNDRSHNSDRLPWDEDGRLKYNWGADDTIMRIKKEETFHQKPEI